MTLFYTTASHQFNQFSNQSSTKCPLLCTNMISLTFSGASDERLACKTSPAIENTLSEGALVAGTARIPWANDDSFGNVSTCCFHHCSKSSDAIEIQRYCCNSRSLDAVVTMCLASSACLAFFHEGSPSPSADEVGLLDAVSTETTTGGAEYFASISLKNWTPLVSC